MSDTRAAERGAAIDHARTSPADYVGAPAPIVDGQGWPALISVALVLLFPLAPLWCVLIIVPLGTYVFWSYRTNAHRHYGDDSAIAVDLLTTLIVIPLVGVVATVGTSWAFYILSIAAPHDRGWTNDGWTVLVCTVAVSAAFVFMRQSGNGRYTPFD